MSLITDIQTSLLHEGSSLAPILLKFKFLASRLKSTPLQNWLGYELEGYPLDYDVPSYRKIEVVYKGTFTGPFNSGIKNAPIPSYLIEKFAGENWTVFSLRQSIAAVDDLIKNSKGGVLSVNSSNLIMMLQGKVYEGYACNDISGSFSVSQLVELQHSVRGRLLDLVIEFENIPGAADIDVGFTPKNELAGSAKIVTQIFNQTVHGTMQNVNNTGSVNSLTFGNVHQNKDALVSSLIEKGLPQADAEAFAELVTQEKPGTVDEPFGERAKVWVAENLKKAAGGSWKIGVSTAAEVLKSAALAYYGLS